MIFYSIVIFGLIWDLVSKYFASIFLNEKINIIWDFFYLFHIKNDGIAFSIDVPFLKIITIVLILGIFYYYFKEEKPKNSRLLDIAFWLILAWAIWNGIERIWFWEVTDFIALQYFAVFNLADSWIFLGALLYIYSTHGLWNSDQKK